tara:strand:- start:497 stop:1222 length:726 start_codon:yes stop_codon:yes gene_type:complete
MSYTVKTNGRLCNQIIRNLSLSLLAKKYDLYVEYSNFDNINNKLGIKLFVGKNKYKSTKRIYDSTYLKYLNSDMNIDYNLNLNKAYFQRGDITTILHSHLKSQKLDIINKNPHKNRYNNNNDLFLHIRLTDVKQFNIGIEYYIKCINLNKYDNIYIGSDDFNHNIIKKIKSLYSNVILFEKDAIDTIQFGSTCKNIILSHGSFSAVIGYLAFYSNVYFPNVDPKWCPLSMFLNKNFIPINV